MPCTKKYNVCSNRVNDSDLYLRSTYSRIWFCRDYMYDVFGNFESLQQWSQTKSVIINLIDIYISFRTFFAGSSTVCTLANSKLAFHWLVLIYKWWDNFHELLSSCFRILNFDEMYNETTTNDIQPSFPIHPHNHQGSITYPGSDITCLLPWMKKFPEHKE